MHHKSEEFLGVDVGDRRVGIARGSSLARLAEPFKTVPSSSAMREISALASQNQTAGIVVGLPRNLEGNDTNQTQIVRNWVKQAQTKINLPFYWQDEALTSKIAEQHISDVGSDAVAASVILQDFLDTPESQRVRC